MKHIHPPHLHELPYDDGMHPYYHSMHAWIYQSLVYFTVYADYTTITYNV